MWTPNERARIQARSGCAPETIKRYPRCTEASRLRIERACREEGIALPVTLVVHTDKAVTDRA